MLTKLKSEQSVSRHLLCTGLADFLIEQMQCRATLPAPVPGCNVWRRRRVRQPVNALRPEQRTRMAHAHLRDDRHEWQLLDQQPLLQLCESVCNYRSIH